MARSNVTLMRKFLRERNLEVVRNWIIYNQSNVKVGTLKRFCKIFNIELDNLEKKDVIMNPTFPLNILSNAFIKAKSHILNEGRIQFGYKSVSALDYRNQDPVLLMHFSDSVKKARGKIIEQPKWGPHVIVISTDAVFARALVASGLSFGRKTMTNPSLDQCILQNPQLFRYHIQATITEEGWCSLTIRKKRVKLEIAWGRVVDITDYLSKEQYDEIKELVEERRRRKIPIKAITDPELYRKIKSNPPKLFDQEISSLNFTQMRKERPFWGIPTRVHLSKNGRVTSFWEIHFNGPDIIDFIHDEYGMLPGTWKVKRFENLYEAYKKYRGRRLTDEEILDVKKVIEENPPKITVEWISKKIQEMFPSVKWGGDLEWIRKKLGR